jgi:ribose-phosphate pyrophosphokinase
VQGRPGLVAGSANRPLAGAVAAGLGTDLLPARTEAFPDGELHVTVGGDVCDRDVYVIQPTGPPAERNLFELVLLGDACRRAGARRVTAVIPYFGYARQDRRAGTGEPVGVRVAAGMLTREGFDGIVVVDPHVPTLEALSPVPATVLTAVPALAGALEQSLPADPVVVAPDLGGAKLAARYASLLGLPLAVVRKTRVSGADVISEEVLGPVADRTPVIVDDMISTGATIAAAVGALAAAGGRGAPLVAATHALFSARAREVLTGLALRRLVVTDTLPRAAASPAGTDVTSIAPLLASTIAALSGRAPGA